jgi:hypothetical protein
MPNVMGCPIPIAEQAILDSADELCRESRILRETIQIDLIPGQADYALTPATVGAFSVEALFARIGTKDPLEPITPDLANGLADLATDPVYIEQVDSETLRLHPAPRTAETMTVTLVLSVESTSTTVPSILDRWRDGVVAGALARLFVINGQPWSNPQMAAAKRQVFDSALNGATAQATLGNMKAQLRVQAHP